MVERRRDPRIQAVNAASYSLIEVIGVARSGMGSHEAGDEILLVLGRLLRYSSELIQFRLNSTILGEVLQQISGRRRTISHCVRGI